MAVQKPDTAFAIYSRTITTDYFSKKLSTELAGSKVSVAP